MRDLRQYLSDIGFSDDTEKLLSVLDNFQSTLVGFSHAPRIFMTNAVVLMLQTLFTENLMEQVAGNLVAEWLLSEEAKISPSIHDPESRSIGRADSHSYIKRFATNMDLDSRNITSMAEESNRIYTMKTPSSNVFKGLTQNNSL